MTDYKNHELPQGYKIDEVTGFIQILTSQAFPEPTEDLPHFGRALGSVRTYLHSVLENNFCPFVKGIEAQNGYYVYPEFAQMGEERFDALSQAAQCAFIHLAGPTLQKPDQTKFLTTMISFHHPKNLEEAFCRSMDEYRNRARMGFLQKGLMISQMHPYHSRESVRGREGDLYSAKVPLLMVRAMHRRDRVFMQNDEEIGTYEGFFESKN